MLSGIPLSPFALRKWSYSHMCPHLRDMSGHCRVERDEQGELTTSHHHCFPSRWECCLM
ncbi:hypothetical protein E2C01_051242 [Portunus trituberculatus]|uniref:Uncharacterized protein n=1 Tax=Portunus trituberculatus TaxID=210409 RepID=A0A5B7GL82_PORTR|nr:hypothetical protein [Portunus trituberculatus]